jgi:hypothetical protein
MRLLPGAMRSLARSAMGVALAFLVASAAASAQEDPTAPPALEACPSAPTAPLSPQTLFMCFYKASARASRAAQHRVGFETRANANPETAPSFAQAATIASEALINIAGRPGGKSALTRVTGVLVAPGAEPSASLSDGVLTVTIVPTRGVAGRPSIGQIERAVRAP